MTVKSVHVQCVVNADSYVVFSAKIAIRMQQYCVSRFKNIVTLWTTWFYSVSSSFALFETCMGPHHRFLNDQKRNHLQLGGVASMSCLLMCVVAFYISLEHGAMKLLHV